MLKKTKIEMERNPSTYSTGRNIKLKLSWQT